MYYIHQFDKESERIGEVHVYDRLTLDCCVHLNADGLHGTAAVRALLPSQGRHSPCCSSVIDATVGSSLKDAFTVLRVSFLSSLSRLFWALGIP
jgi:hypothetical protein